MGSPTCTVSWRIRLGLLRINRVAAKRVLLGGVGDPHARERIQCDGFLRLGSKMASGRFPVTNLWHADDRRRVGENGHAVDQRIPDCAILTLGRGHKCSLDMNPARFPTTTGIRRVNSMPDDILQSVTHFGIASLIVLVFVVLIVAVGSGTSLGRAMLPDSVTTVVRKLLPFGSITDGSADGIGHFKIRVQGTNRLKTVNVQRFDKIMVAWTSNPDQSCPQSGTFAFAEYRHNLAADADADADSPSNPEKIKSRIESALDDSFASKQFIRSDTDSADILVSVFTAIENEVPVETLQDSFDHDDNEEWKSAIKAAMQHDGAETPATIACGSMTIGVFDASSKQVLWRAATIGQIVVDVSESERKRRIDSAISAMLKHFPPA